MSVSEQILDAIELLANNSVEKAGYDKTIQAQIVSCEDATIGKYRCRYQDAIFYAYSGSADVTFTNGSYVYILIPSGDMSKEKTILGTTKKLGINYISQAQGEEAYDLIGNNCITSKNTFYLNSNIKNYSYTIYSYSGTKNITLDTTSLNQYIKQSSSLIAGATFKTDLPPARQYRGHYGIKFNLRFKDNTSNQEVIRSYIIDEDKMVDNPYRLLYATRQYEIFDIDGPNFIRVESIELFSSDFPNATATTAGLLSSGDIIITNLEICGAVRMSEEEVNGVAISFYTPQGTFFTSSSTTSNYKTITAQVRVKGKLVSASQNIPFYWGSENVGISSSSQYYNKYLGRGWQCLNDSNVIAAGTSTTNPIIEWVPGKDTYVLYFNKATARNNKIKVAIVYDGNVITKQINIQNLVSSVPQITIESNGGTKFYYDIGHPTLTLKMNGAEPSTSYKCYWAYQSSQGGFQELPVTTALNTQYDAAVTALNNLKTAINNGTKFANAEANNLKTLENNVKAFDFIQRVKHNKIYDVQIKDITSFGTFKCSLYNSSNVYLGTASITLTNTLEGEDLYSVVINNGSAVFQYDENGVAPNSKSLNVQQQIQSLSFTVYDNLGNPIDDAIISNTNNCKIRWAFPIKNTLLVDDSGNGASAGTDQTQTYKYYDNKMILLYNIAQKYDIQKQRNQIKLTIDYKGMNLTTETDFTFAKQGQPGTNGTEYVVKLVPNTRMSNPPLWPMVTKAGAGYVINYGINSTATEQTINAGTGYQFFKAQLWFSGQLVWEGMTASTAATDGVTKPTNVSWQILRNKYNSSSMDASAFTITNASSGYISYAGDRLASAFTTPLANIIKCSITWQNKTYYGTIPITTAWTNNANFRVELKDYTGFRYAIYTSDGMTPQYDSSHPFEFICKEKINNIWEDISLVTGTYTVNYTISRVGNYLSTKNGAATNSNLIEILTSSAYRTECNKNQWRARPVSRYDGVCINAAICCEYRQNNVIIGRINVPIHFLLNKYGLANINAWDGNSVQLDDKGGFILAPQMGAGQKESDNSFTGVLMGQTRIPGKATSQNGLLGYNRGERTFFLNSKNGSALFGKSNQGQIVIDPSTTQRKAMIYSGNFWKTYNTDGDYDELPSSYTYRDSNFKTAGNGAGKGMIIDLTTPEIYFGTGNFYVTGQGYVHAAAGGQIGGWKMDSHSLYSNIANANGRITLDSGTYDATTNKVTGPGKLYSHTHSTLTNTGVGFYLSYDGLSIGSKAKLTNAGVMYIGNGAVANGGTTNGNYWTINGDGTRSYISFGGSTAFSEASDDNGTAAKVYLGTDGISLGTRFSVDKQGHLIAYSGKIGGWNITKTVLSAGNIELNSNGTMKGGSAGVTADGIQYDNKWSISLSGVATFNRLVANKSGQIGGWNISENTLSAGNIYLNANGTMKGGSKGVTDNGTQYDNQWSISLSGVATFNHIVANKSGKIAGWNINSTYLKGGNLTLNSDGSIHGANWHIYASGATSGLKLNGGNVNIQAGSVITSGGQISASGGYLGSGSSTIAPLSWTPNGVTLRNNTLITDGATISGNVSITGGVKIGGGVTIGGGAVISDGAQLRSGAKIGADLSIDSKGQLSYQGGSGWNTVILAQIIKSKMISAETFTANNKQGRTGTITFSDGSSITVTGGLITYVKAGTEAKYSGN